MIKHLKLHSQLVPQHADNYATFRQVTSRAAFKL